jgi:transposase
MRTTYVGMDIHKNFIQAAALDEEGNVIKEQKFKSNEEEIKRFFQNLNAQKVNAAIEATCTWYHVYETLHALDVETTLVNMRRTKTIAESKIKTDKLDAMTIAQCLRTGFIATAYIPPKNIMEQRNILRHRISLRKEIVRYKNKIHAILLRNGIQHHEYSDLFGAGGMKFLRGLTLSDSEQYSLTSYLNIVETLVREKTQISKKIEILCKNNHQAMLLTSIPGISYYSAMIILTEMGEVQRFSNPKKLCSYAGLVPRTIQSGNHVYHGRILKECNHNLKWILDQCTHIHIKHCPNSSITKLYCRIETKKGANKATVAASRKLLTCIWHMLARDETFKYNNVN